MTNQPSRRSSSSERATWGEIRPPEPGRAYFGYPQPPRVQFPVPKQTPSPIDERRPSRQPVGRQRSAEHRAAVSTATEPAATESRPAASEPTAPGQIKQAPIEPGALEPRVAEPGPSAPVAAAPRTTENRSVGATPGEQPPSARAYQPSWPTKQTPVQKTTTPKSTAHRTATHKTATHKTATHRTSTQQAALPERRPFRAHSRATRSRVLLHLIGYPLVVLLGALVGAAAMRSGSAAEGTTSKNATSPQRPAIAAGPAAASRTEIRTDGIFVVGPQLAPGRYVTSGGPIDCYWARLSDVAGTPKSIITSGDALGRTTVTIKRSDAAFKSAGCNGWTRL